MNCFICGTNRAVQEHHIIPQSVGGELGPTVWLCGNHHSLIHKTALQALAKKSKGIKYLTDEEMIRARPLIQAIMMAVRNAQSNPNLDQKASLYLKPSKRLITVLHILKNDAGFTNLNDFCVWILAAYARSKI